MRLGVDMGATAIKSGLVDDQGTVCNKQTTPTGAERGGAAVLENLEAACRLQMAQEKVESIGIGLPGRVDPRTGSLVDATNLPLQDTPIAPMLTQRLGVPVYVGNDANCALLGEMLWGEGRRLPYSDAHMLMVTVGTGIGGAIEIGGKIYRGRLGNASEVGHMTICYTGERCCCGRIGCWEYYASVTGLMRQTIRAAEKAPDSLLAWMARESAVDGRTVFTAAREGCNVAEQVIEQYAAYLAHGINNLTTIFRPDRLVMAGAIFNEGEYLRSRIEKHCIDPAILRISELHDRAGLLGAASLCDLYAGRLTKDEG